jgi:hypothetical protein
MNEDEMMFREGDDGGGFGGGGGDLGGGAEPSEGSRGAAVFEGGEGQGQAPKGPPAQPQAQPQGPVAAPAQVDARQLAAEFGQVIGQHFQPPRQQISVEEAKRILNVWEPTPEWLAKYDNLETRNQAIAEQRDGLIRQADTIMQYRMREMQQMMEERYAPVVHHMRQQEARAGEWRFAQSYPQLNNPALRPLLFSVAQNLLAAGARFRSEGEMFQAIARGVESVIKVSNPQFSLEAAAASNGKPVGQSGGQRPVGSLPVTTPGAGGGGGPKGPAPVKPRGLAIFDPT